jgi:hypothetical protein
MEIINQMLNLEGRTYSDYAHCTHTHTHAHSAVIKQHYTVLRKVHYTLLSVGRVTSAMSERVSERVRLTQRSADGVTGVVQHSTSAAHLHTHTHSETQ